MNVKRGVIVLFLGFFLFFISGYFGYDVSAARDVCTTTAYSEMRAKAFSTTFTSELKFGSDGVAYFEVTYANLQEGIEIHYGENVYSYDPKKPTGTIKTLFQNTGATYNFEMYSAYGYPCVGELLYTKSVTLPKYNKYSEYEECIEYEEFALCNKWYRGDIESEEYFYKKLEEYKASIAPPEEEPPIVLEEKNFFEQMIDFYVENLIITLPVTVLLLGTFVFIVVRKVVRYKRRVKIDI